MRRSIPAGTGFFGPWRRSLADQSLSRHQCSRYNRLKRYVNEGIRPMIANIPLPRQMVVGGGALKELPELLGRVGIVKPLIVTDPFMRDSGRLAAGTDLLHAAR